jgi:hypothetical protein
MFAPLAALAVHEAAKQIATKGAIVEFGNQRFGAAGTIPGTEQIKETRDFYRHLGFTDYVAVDMNSKMSAEVMDLNKSLRRDYGYTRSFSLVTNIGTGEHVFDQRSVFENMHDLCEVGGVMLNMLPSYGWVNHGFFNFQPVLFRDLAYANGYQWLFLWIGDRWGQRAEVGPGQMVFEEKKPEAVTQVLRHPQFKGDPFIVAAYRKQKAEPFRLPIQGKYHRDIENTQQFSDYKLAR